MKYRRPIVILLFVLLLSISIGMLLYTYFERNNTHIVDCYDQSMNKIIDLKCESIGDETYKEINRFMILVTLVLMILLFFNGFKYVCGE